jgi:predicted small metal-binding protein
MKKKLIAALLALAFGLSATALVRAEEAAKSEEAKAPMYMAKCPDPCSFSVKSHDKAEVISVIQEHAKSHHNGMVVSDADAAAMVKVVEPKK